jgi:uncharacterized HhH-GPD family protein
MTIQMPVSPEANDLLTRDPLALLVGMILDQQLADFDPDALAAIFSERPALHRYPRSMSARVQEVARLIVSEYEGDAAALWATASSGAELYKRISGLAGFGPQKARIFIALLGKQFGVRPEGWQEASSPFGADGSFLSVADIVDEASLGRVREYKLSLKAKPSSTRSPRSAG